MNGYLEKTKEACSLPSSRWWRQMIESLGTDQFTAKSFRLHGGRTGLLNLYIEQARISVARRGVPGDQALLILRQLAPRSQTESRANGYGIAESLGLPVAQVTKALVDFAELGLVNRLPKGSASGIADESGPRYELMHEHLARILQEAPDTTLRRAKEAEDRLTFWRERTESEDRSTEAPSGLQAVSRVRSLFSQPIPLAEVLRLWRSARSKSDRKMLLRSFRGLSLQGAMVVLPAILILMATFTDRYQIYRIIADSPSMDPAALVASVTSIGGSLAFTEARSMDTWIAIQSKTGYAKQADAELESAIKRLQDEAGTNDYGSVVASVFLNARKAEVRFASADTQGVQKSLEDAESAFNKLSASGCPDLDLCFIAAARIGEATTLQTQPAIDWWNSAFGFAKKEGGYGDNADDTFTRSEDWMLLAT